METTICESLKVFYNVKFEPTTLSDRFNHYAIHAVHHSPQQKTISTGLYILDITNIESLTAIGTLIICFKYYGTIFDPILM